MDLKEAVTDTPKKYGLGLRHVQTLMLFLGMVLAFAMRVNMSLAVVAMTDKDNDEAFDWSIQTQSIILSSFFWGYVVLQIPGGELAARFGGMVLFTICISVNSIISLLIPLASYYGGWQLVCACRVIQGLTQGVMFPSTHNLIGKWVPLEEKSRLGTIIYAGGQFGTALQLILSGFIAESWGWPAIFYSNGVAGVIWTVVYVFIGSDSPQNSRYISEKEKYYIQNSLGQVGGENKKLKTPWMKIFTSLPFISLIIVHCGQNWGFWTLMTEMPSYMKQVLGVDIKANGVMSALPYIAMYLLSFPLGYLADLFLRKNWFAITTVRKLSNSIGHYGPALALIGLSYSPAGNVTVAVALLTIVVGLNAGHYTGYLLVHIDMAPNFAGTLMGITNCIANIISIITPLAAGALLVDELVHIDMAPNFAGTLMGITNCIANIISIITPLAAGALLVDETDPADWRKVFYLSSAIYIVCNTFFVIFGTSERQQWNEVPDENDTNVAEQGTKVEKAA